MEDARPGDRKTKHRTSLLFGGRKLAQPGKRLAEGRRGCEEACRQWPSVRATAPGCLPKAQTPGDSMQAKPSSCTPEFLHPRSQRMMTRVAALTANRSCDLYTHTVMPTRAFKVAIVEDACIHHQQHSRAPTYSTCGTTRQSLIACKPCPSHTAHAAQVFSQLAERCLAHAYHRSSVV